MEALRGYCWEETGLQSDAELVGEVIQGRRASYGLLVERYERAVMATALQILRDPEKARDVAQDVFLAAYQKLATLRRPADFGSWLLTIARNRALSALRQQSRSPVILPLMDNPPAREVESSALTSTVLDGITALPEREREVILMHYFDRLSVKDISTATGRPVGTVTKQLSRAYERLRTMLSKTEWGETLLQEKGKTCE